MRRLFALCGLTLAITAALMAQGDLKWTLAGGNDVEGVRVWAALTPSRIKRDGATVRFWVRETPVFPTQAFLKEWGIADNSGARDPKQFQYRQTYMIGNCQRQEVAIAEIIDYWKDSPPDFFKVPVNRLEYERTAPETYSDMILTAACETSPATVSAVTTKQVVQGSGRGTTRNASPFTQEYIGPNYPPTVFVQNDAPSTLNLLFGGARYSIVKDGAEIIRVTPGVYEFSGSVRGAKPLAGHHSFEQGYRYTWTFFLK